MKTIEIPKFKITLLSKFNNSEITVKRNVKMYTISQFINHSRPLLHPKDLQFPYI